MFEEQLKKIELAEINMDLYPYFIIDKFFDNDMYQIILENIECIQYIPVLNCITRETIEIIDYIKNNNINTKFKEICEFLISNKLKLVLLNKFRKLLEDKNLSINNNLSEKDKKYNMRGLIIKDSKDYEIYPHTDLSRKVITFIIYLPKDDQFKKHGTNILKSINNIKCWDSVRHNPEDFEIYKLCEYIPNRMLCFMKTDNSWHSVTRIDNDIKRYSFNIQVQLPK